MQSIVSQNNRRIARNTMMLYFRQFLVMFISLYTSRIILQNLGVEDFGIYNVVGGIISMIGLIKGVMAGGSSRYLNYALGKEDLELAKKTFSVSLAIYVVICIILVIVAETVGLWFLNTQLVIPSSRIVAANWVYQFTILSCVNSIMAIPYNSAIIAHEKMDVYAYIGIFEVLMKLIIAYVLTISHFDRLIVYGLLMLLVDLTVRMFYRVYCIKRYEECKFKIYKDKAFYKEILSYSSWNMFGSVASLVKGQGLNILLNMFFNPSVNAARGIAYQINSVFNQFSNNFFTAVKPQITKYYAKGDMENMFTLVFRSSKMSFYLILLMSLPVIIETPFIIELWLGQLPENVVPFVRLIVVISAIEGMAHPLMTTAHATGNIALYQSTVGTVTMLNIPISYIFLSNGFPPVTVFIVSMIIAVICLFLRLWIVKRLVDFPAMDYIRKVFGTCLLVAVVAMLIPIAVYINVSESFLNVIMVCILTVMSTVTSIYFMGLQPSERNFISNAVLKKIKR